MWTDAPVRRVDAANEAARWRPAGSDRGEESTVSERIAAVLCSIQRDNQHNSDAQSIREMSVMNMWPGAWVIILGTRASSAAACAVTPQAQKTGTSS
jgi:hypothetical protein